ncbi:hypothetical protein [Pediococcus pentosaceus]|uniref:hypothetical protein n=1 Tax=Pediococcus pentosaceus TaxID=1255 RepID=UPI00398202FB
MGIKNLESYKPTDHAKQRFEERFMTSSFHLDAWLSAFNKHASLCRREAGGREIWQSGEAVLIIEPAKKKIITVYTKEGRPNIGRVIHNERLKAELIQFAYEHEQSFKIETAKKLHEQLIAMDAAAFGLSMGTLNYVPDAFNNLLNNINGLVDTKDEARDYMEQLERLRG